MYVFSIVSSDFSFLFSIYCIQTSYYYICHIFRSKLIILCLRVSFVTRRLLMSANIIYYYIRIIVMYLRVLLLLLLRLL